MRALLLPAALVLATAPTLAPAAALDPQPGAVQLNIPMSVRSLGMGWVATGGSDVLRAWSNPASLVDGGTRGEAALVGGAVLEDTQQFGIAGSWKINPDWAVGVAVVRYGFAIDEVDAFGDPAGRTAEQSVMSESLMTAYRWRSLRAGLALKGIQETIAETSVSAGAADIGLAATWMGVTGSLALRNLGAALLEGDEALGIPGEDLPTEMRIGAAYRMEAVKLGGAVDYFKTAGRDGRIGLGIEYWPIEWLAVRAGGILPGDAAQLTAGFSALWKVFVLDIATAFHSSGANLRAAVSYGFGAPAEPRPARTEEREGPVARVEERAPAPVPVAKGATQLNLAVADLKAENVSSGNAAVMADLLRGELVKTKAFNVVEKANMDKVLAEQAFQQTGCSSEECAVKLGKLLNVQRMVVGSFGQLLDSYFLNVRVVDVETGRVIFGDSAEGKTVSDLKTGVRDLAKRIASQVR